MTSEYTDLVVVACHAHFLGDPGSPDCDVFAPSQWNLKAFQQPVGKKPGEHEAFLQHIQAGLDALTFGCIKETSILVFSGGSTARETTQLSEARSYYNAALALTKRSARGQPCAEWLGSRILLEEYATDSYQNLLFSILEFRKATGRYPENIRIITHAFKTERFVLSHARAIRWPQDHIRVQGIDPVMSINEYTETVDGERQRGYLPWMRDVYGIQPPLSSKRTQRGWQSSALEKLGEGLEDEVKALLNYDGGENGHAYFDGPLPWTA